jgi:hypothetical protein
MNYRALYFADMPLGKRPDLKAACSSFNLDQLGFSPSNYRYDRR